MIEPVNRSHGSTSRWRLGLSGEGRVDKMSRKNPERLSWQKVHEILYGEAKRLQNRIEGLKDEILERIK